MSRETVKEPMEESLQDKAYDLLGDMLVERHTARYMQELEADAARGGDAERLTPESSGTGGSLGIRCPAWHRQRR